MELVPARTAAKIAYTTGKTGRLGQVDVYGNGNTALQVDLVADTTAPLLVGNLEMDSVPAANDTYNTGETIQVRATFTEEIRIVGTPTLPVTIGAAQRIATCTAPTTDRTTLICSYTVITGAVDADGIAIAANSLTSASGTSVTDLAGNAAITTHPALAAPRHKVNGS